MKAKKKPVKLGKLKDKLWELTSKYVRLSAANENGYASCVTCGMTKRWTELQAGHFIPQARGNAVRFDLRNIAVQCYRCNINLGGNGPEYYPYMLKAHGQAVIDELRGLAGMSVKFTRADYEDMISDVANRLAELAEGDVRDNPGTRWALMNLS